MAYHERFCSCETDFRGISLWVCGLCGISSHEYYGNTHHTWRENACPLGRDHLKIPACREPNSFCKAPLSDAVTATTEY